MFFLQYSFFQNAIIGGVLSSVLCSLLGVFVVQRKMSFLGSGLSHSALGGVGLALLLGAEPLFIAIPFTIAVGLLITLLKEKTVLEQDTSIGIMFSAATALGIIFLALKDGYVGDAHSYLFGSILAISTLDIAISLAFTAITIVFLYFFWGKLAYLTFDKSLAIADKINLKLCENLFSIILSVAIVISIKLVGIILISAALILPAATARLYSKTFSQMTILSLLFGLVGTIIGLCLSLVLDLPSGASIIILQSVLFGGSIVVSKMVR